MTPPTYTDATRYEVSCLPLGHPDRSAFTITVEWRSPDRWAVCLRSECLSRTGKWHYERQPSSRTDRFKEYHRHPLDLALALAQTHAPKITCNGFTVEEALARRAVPDPAP
jgi:hypothetical protein